MPLWPHCLGSKIMTQSCSLVFVSNLCLSYIFVSLKCLNNCTSLNQYLRNIAVCRFVHSALDRALDKDLCVSEAWMLQHGGVHCQITVDTTVWNSNRPQFEFIKLLLCCRGQCAALWQKHPKSDPKLWLSFRFQFTLHFIYYISWHDS